MKIELAYGRGHLPIEVPEQRTTIIEPSHNPGLSDEQASVLQALDNPIGAPALKDWIKSGSRVCIVFTDITRATPNDRLIPWLLKYLWAAQPHQITLLNGVGTHRPNTRAELEKLLTPAVVNAYRVLNHEPENPKALVAFGTTQDGTPAFLNRHVVEADVRIITGFIEPHFFCGF